MLIARRKWELVASIGGRNFRGIELSIGVAVGARKQLLNIARLRAMTLKAEEAKQEKHKAAERPTAHVKRVAAVRHFLRHTGM